MKVLLVGIVLCISTYAAMFNASIRRIDAFCSRVSVGSPVGELATMAALSNVELRGPLEHPEGSGHFFVHAASEFTLGDYACQIETDGKHVTTKQLGAN